VFVNNGASSYVALYHAYAQDPAPFRVVTTCIDDPASIWLDGRGRVYVGNLQQNANSVCEYGPGMEKVLRKYTVGISLPFAGMVDRSGTMYVSDGAEPHGTQGEIAVYPARKVQPSTYLTDNVHVPHGMALDGAGDLFLAQVFGDSSSVLEFAAGSSSSVVLPLDLPSQAFLEDLKVDAKGEIVVADAYLSAVRFFAPPFGPQTSELTAGLISPTALAYGPDGSLFVGNEYIDEANGNVVVFAPGASSPSRTIATGIRGGVLGIALDKAR
jgi:hypothetical protein